MVECIQNNKGMAELYVVLEMLLEQIVVLVFFFFFVGKNQGKKGGRPSTKKRHVAESLLAVPHFKSRSVFVLGKDVSKGNKDDGAVLYRYIAWK